VQEIASRKRLVNVEPILSDCETGLPADSVDVVLLYDTLHDLDDPYGVLVELHRVLKREGNLSLSDHHMKDAEMVSQVTRGGLFRMSARTKRTYGFSKEE
jgi:ubiquinone/menaquinone biosynthesis C-methylase UbiE